MTRAKHIARHKILHQAFDELLADWITHTGRLPSQATIFELMEWSYAQTISPAEHEPAAPVLIDTTRPN